MKGSIRAVAALLGMTGLIGSVATYKVAAIIFTGMQHASITYHIDERLSQKSQQQIIAHIENNRSISPQDLINDVRTQFGCIDSIQLKYTPYTAEMHISARELSAVVNDQFVVTISGIMLEKEQYSPFLFDNLKHINMHELCEIKLPAIIHSWIDRAPFELFKAFDVVWFDENNIELKNKKDSQLVIRCAHTQSVDSLAIDACRDAKQALMNDNWVRHHEVIADVRFDRQIIISKR